MKLYNQDCLEAMKQMEDNQFDLAIVDPPYGIGDFQYKKKTTRHKKIEWNNEIPTKEYFYHLQRISKNKIVFGVNYFTKYIKDVGRIVHDKTGCNKRKNPKDISSVDIASHSFGLNMKIFHYVSIGNVIGNTIDWKNKLRWHPCQKPIALYEWLLINYAKKGDKILDTHLGSGSIAIACHNLGYDLTGYEIDKEYYKASIKRIEQHKSQIRLAI
jgi:site-specific DNA-methyltransferase (adenine-specific)